MQQRVVIIGNSGSGKSYFADELASVVGSAVVHLDRIFWMPGGFNEKRTPNEVDRLISGHKDTPTWIVEGVFGELAQRFLNSAEMLVWLDMPWEVCRSSLTQRGSQSSEQRSHTEAEESLRALLLWASEYWSRTNLRSHSGHARLFDEFTGPKLRFTNRADVDAYLHEMKTEPNQALHSTPVTPSED